MLTAWKDKYISTHHTSHRGTVSQGVSFTKGITDENELPAVMLADLTAYSEVEIVRGE